MLISNNNRLIISNICISKIEAKEERILSSEFHQLLVINLHSLGLLINKKNKATPPAAKRPQKKEKEDENKRNECKNL